MKQAVSAAFSDALNDSVPVMFGYVPLGLAFGVLFQSLGYHWMFAPLAGLLVYAGSAQFMAVGLLASGVTLTETFFATLLLNSRHFFYGLSVLNRYPKKGLARWYLIFGLTDETYSLITAKPRGLYSSPRYYLWLTALNQLYWVLGCGFGAGIQSYFSFNSEGFEFALVALFVVLLLQQISIMEERWLLWLALVASLFSVWLFPDQFLTIAILICLACLIIKARLGLVGE